MSAVGRAGGKIVVEVRRQFQEIKGLMEGKARPDYARCVDIVTVAALREMRLPAIMAIVTPIVVGILFGVNSVGGLLLGATTSGFVLAVMMANAGGAWDNAKKYIEEGHHGGKGSFAHKAGCGRRHGRGPVQGHGRPEPEYPHQIDVDGLDRLRGVCAAKHFFPLIRGCAK